MNKPANGTAARIGLRERRGPIIKTFSGHLAMRLATAGFLCLTAVPTLAQVEASSMRSAWLELRTTAAFIMFILNCSGQVRRRPDRRRLVRAGLAGAVNR